MTNTKYFRAKAFIFDVEGTMIDSTTAVKRHWHQFALENGLDENKAGFFLNRKSCASFNQVTFLYIYTNRFSNLLMICVQLKQCLNGHLIWQHQIMLKRLIGI